jgi:hypothetical protein
MTTSILTLDTSNAHCEISNLCSFTTDCGCQYQTPVSDYVVTPRHGVVSVVHRVIDLAQDALAAVKSVACSAGRKIKAAWNGFRMKVAQNFRRVKNGTCSAGRYLRSKIVAGAFALLIALIVAQAYLCYQWNRAKTKTINLYTFSKIKIVTTTIRFTHWTTGQWKALRRLIDRGMKFVKPYGIQVARVTIVATALYLIATAGLLVCCVIVAALGVQTFDHLQKIGIIPKQPAILERPQKSFSLQA